jgi:hypothetical protein
MGPRQNLTRVCVSQKYQEPLLTRVEELPMTVI